MCNDMKNSNTIQDIENNIDEFYDMLHNKCKPIFKNKSKVKTCNRANNITGNKPWYDNECKRSKRDFNTHLNNFRKADSDQNRENLVQSRSYYKKLTRRKKYQYGIIQTEKLEKLRYKNAKEYWKLLKSSTNNNNKKPNISTQQFANYFKAINNPQSVFFQLDEAIRHFNERYLNGELQVMFNELDNEISYIEIHKACKELNNNRSGGADYIINEFLKYGYDYLADYLYAVLNN